jgi:hypothetical protein
MNPDDENYIGYSITDVGRLPRPCPSGARAAG